MIPNERAIQLGIAVLLTMVGSFLLIAGFFVDPVGQISESVLFAYGEVMTFAGAILGIDYVYGYKLRRLKDAMKEEEEDKKKN